MSADVVITGIGAVTPVGAGAVQSCASVRAGFAGLQRHPSYYPLFPDPIVDEPEPTSCGITVGDDDCSRREERSLEMGLAATRELVRAAALTRAQTCALDVLLCLPESGDGRPAFDDRVVVKGLARRLGIALDNPVTVISEGAPGAFGAIAEAAARIGAGRTERCLVLATDSLVGDDMLLWFDEHDRLRSDRTADGFFAGEAAACFLLERADAAQAREATILARVTGVGLGDEPNTVAGDANSTGQGLCQAIRAATRSWGAQPIHWAIGDMNGESYGAYEWGLATSRLGSTLGATQLWHPADSMGATGAAASALAVALASRALAAGYALDDRVLLWCSSDGKRRAACAITAPTGGS